MADYDMWKEAGVKDRNSAVRDNAFGYGRAGGRGVSVKAPARSMVNMPKVPNVTGDTVAEAAKGMSLREGLNRARDRQNQVKLEVARRLQDGPSAPAGIGRVDPSTGSLSRDSYAGSILSAAENNAYRRLRDAEFTKRMAPHVRPRPTDADIKGLWRIPGLYGYRMNKLFNRWQRRQQRHRNEINRQLNIDLNRSRYDAGDTRLSNLSFQSLFNTPVGPGNTYNVDSKGNVRVERQADSGVDSLGRITNAGHARQVAAIRRAFMDQMDKANIGVEEGTELHNAVQAAIQNAVDYKGGGGYTVEGLENGARAFIKNPAIQTLRSRLIARGENPHLVDNLLERMAINAMDASRQGEFYSSPDFKSYRRGK